MTSTALTVSILSEDTDLLREASWWLSAFGYKVHAVRDAKLLSTVWEGWQTDFLIVDAEHSAVETAAHLPQESHEHFTYRILLRRLDAPAYATHELEYVFNDALCRPLNYGEMLARLRAGARFNELERRERRQAIRDGATGLLTRQGLTQSMQFQAGKVNTSTKFSIALFCIDFFEPLTRAYGEPAAADLAKQVAKLAVAAAGDGALIGRTGPGEFAVVRAGQPADRCRDFAAQFCEAVESQTLEVAGQSLRITASGCIGEWCPRSAPLADVLRDSERTLQHARTMGGSVICTSGKFDAEFAAWTQSNVQSGVALAQLQARDVMTPFVLALAGEPEGELWGQTLNSGVDLIALVDEAGKYAGVLNFRELDEGHHKLSRPVQAMPCTVSEETPFSELVEMLTTDQKQVVVLSEDEKPLGYVSCASMASLLEPVYVETFHQIELSPDESAPLPTPEMAGVE